MAAAFRPRLGMALQNAILPGDQPPMDMGDFTPGQGMGQPKPKGGFFREGGMGRTIAGLIGDALLQQADMAPVYAPAMRQQQNLKAEEAQWTRRRQADREDKRWEWDNKPPETPAMLRDVQTWAQMTDDQRTAYRQMQEAKGGDPIINMSLGQDRFYSGPRSGLATALGSAGASLDTTPTVEDGMSYTPGPGGRGNPGNWKAVGGPQASPAGTFSDAFEGYSR